MPDLEQVRTDITAWLINFVEKPNPMLNGWAPCPFARRSRVENLLDIRLGQVNPVSDLQHVEMQHYEVIACVYDPDRFSAEQFNTFTMTLNEQYLIPRGMIALCDHPDDTESVNGVVMNQGVWAIVFLQNLEKLNAHARQLADKGYYDAWPEEYLTQLFTGRADPRINI